MGTLYITYLEDGADDLETGSDNVSETTGTESEPRDELDMLEEPNPPPP